MSIFDKLKGGMGLEGFEEEEIEEKEEKKPEPKAKKKNSKKIKVTEESSKPAIKDDGEIEEKNDFSEPEGELAVDVYQTDQDIIIQTAVAGVKPDDIDVSIEDDVVTIKGHRKETTTEEKKNYYFQECFWGAFSRQIILPEEVDVSKMEATFQDNILTLRMPKLSRKKTRKIKVQS